MNKQLSHGDLIRACRSIESRMTKNLVEYCLAKFDRGLLLREVVSAEDRYGKGVMETIADELGYSEQTLYLEHTLAKFFNYDRSKLEAEIEKAKKKNLRPSFEYFRKQLNPAQHPEMVGGEENHAKLAAKKIETLAEEVSDAIDRHPENQEVQGAVIAGVEVLENSAEWLVGNVTHPGITKQEKVELPHYLAWVRKREPLVAGRGPVEAHHLILKARGNASMDLFAIPLPKSIHEEYHKLGHEAWEQKHQINTRLVCLLQLQEYIQSHK